MAIQTKATLVGYFPNGATPQGSEFEDLIDTLVAIDTTNTYFGAGSVPLAVIGTTYRGRVADEEVGIYSNAGVGQALITRNGITYGNFDYLKQSVEALPVWNMDTTGYVDVDLTSYLTRGKIRSVDVMITSDAGGVYGASHRGAGADWSMPTSVSDGVVRIERELGGIFDSSAFSATAVSRGKMIVTYDPTS
jgi:hypothetical protein